LLPEVVVVVVGMAAVEVLVGIGKFLPEGLL
jgi:hypothetical protein